MEHIVRVLYAEGEDIHSLHPLHRWGPVSDAQPAVIEKMAAAEEQATAEGRPHQRKSDTTDLTVPVLLIVGRT